MKKLFSVIALLICGLVMGASPVSLEEAQTLAQRFSSNTFEQTRQSGELSLVYSTPTFYVFNVGQNGFVIISADDSYRPIIGYSEENVFEPDNMAPALQEYLNNINEYRMQRGTVVADVEVARDWESLREYGRMVSRFGGRDAGFLLTTKWNQNYPYNYYCPADANGPGGRAYAGCVATAAAQVMKYWDHPEHGSGSHSYVPQDNPQYGTQTANFGATTYDWNNMPNSISSGSSMVQIQAVATLIYHCGVAVDMNYRPTGSGAATTQLCTVMPQYFSYSNQMTNIKRENYTKETYLNMVFKSIDKEWPLIHRGGGHAYVLDGYDDFGLVHFNWGWSGSNDAFFDIDGHNYTDGQSMLYNSVPADVYNNTPNVPTNVVVTAGSDDQLTATVAWNNPAKTLNNQNLTSIDRIVVKRNNVVVFTQENVTPGAQMSFVDDVPCFDAYTYRIYAVCNGHVGESAFSNQINVGPTCQWKFVVSSSNMTGWNGAHIALYNAVGTEFGSVTTTNSQPAVLNVDLPVGKVRMAWVGVESSSNNTISINIKDTDNNSVYSYSGNILDMEDGLLCEVNNGCGNPAPASAPKNLNATDDGNNIILTWGAVSSKDGYGYNVYRDGYLIRIVNDTEFVDEDLSMGGHCYHVTFLGFGGESSFSNEACGNVGEGCDTGSNLWYEVQTNNFKPIITWEAPENHTGLSGYFVYRKDGADGEYTRVQIVGANKTQYKETKTLVDETVYYYKVIPFYQAIDCYAAPIKARYGNKYHVEYYYSVDAVGENYDNNVSIYPNPTNGNVKIEAESLSNVAIFNLMGQKVYEENISGDEYVIDMNEFGTGLFMIKIQSASGTSIQKITVIE